MHWLYLALAIALELIGTTCIKLSAGWQHRLPSVVMIVCYAGCAAILSLAIKVIPVSVAYAIWSGLGTALMALIGVVWFQEGWTLIKGLGIVAVIVGVVLLNLEGER